MAIRSMTGFGRGEASAGGTRVEAELSSLNRKQFDLRLTLPRQLSVLDSYVYELVHAQISRGGITGNVNVSVSPRAQSRRASVNTELAAAYVRKLRAAARSLSLRDNLGAAELAGLPDVVRCESVPEDTRAVWPLLQRALRMALRELVAMRIAEGRVLAADLGRRLGVAVRRLRRIESLAPRVRARYRRLLVERIRSAGVDIEHGDHHVLKEVALFAERSDISEEIVRLRSHLGQACRLLSSNGPAGRTLDFLCQEMFREVNTIGAKGNDAAISRHVIAFKSDLECIREQVQNVE